MAKYNIRTLSEKEAILSYYQRHGWQATLKKYDVSRASLVNWQLRAKAAKASDKHPLARHYMVRPETVAFVKQLHKKHPNMSLSQLMEKARQKQSISRTTVWKIITGVR